MSTQYSDREYNNNNRNQRQPEMTDMHAMPRRNTAGRERGSRSSDGTVRTMKSYSTEGASYRTGRESNATHQTEATEIEPEEPEEILKPQPYYSKKMVVVGDGGCGKTCLLITYSKGYFPDKYIPTVFENYITFPKPGDGKSMEMGLWDTAGQEEYDRLRPLSYPQTDLLLVCFAIDCPNSLDNVMDKWFPEVTHFCPYSPIFLVGLKSDLRDNRNCINMLKAQGLAPISEEQGRAVAQRMKAQYMECSSKEFTGVTEVFQRAIKTMVESDPRNAPTQQASAGPKSDLRGMSKKKKKRSCKIL